MKIKKGDLISFTRDNTKVVALVLHVNENKRTPKLNVYKVMYNNIITHAINYKLEKL